jgi:hypothetical protein
VPDAVLPPLPEDDPDASLLIRTDFTDDGAWLALVEEAGRPVGPDGFQAGVQPVDDRGFENLQVADLVAAVTEDGPFLAFLADAASMHGHERTLVAVDLADTPGRTFRVTLPALWSVENNLRLANMGFDELADAVDEDGTFRGFEG